MKQTTYFAVCYNVDKPAVPEHQIKIEINRNKYESLLLDATKAILVDGVNYIIEDKVFMEHHNLIYNQRFVILKIKYHE